MLTLKKLKCYVGTVVLSARGLLFNDFQALESVTGTECTLYTTPCPHLKSVCQVHPNATTIYQFMMLTGESKCSAIKTLYYEQNPNTIVECFTGLQRVPSELTTLYD